jgi:hypothetical protein
MTQNAPSILSKFSASDLTKLKQFLVDNLSRGIESEGIAFEQRSEFI